MSSDQDLSHSILDEINDINSDINNVIAYMSKVQNKENSIGKAVRTRALAGQSKEASPRNCPDDGSKKRKAEDIASEGGSTTKIRSSSNKSNQKASSNKADQKASSYKADQKASSYKTDQKASSYKTDQKASSNEGEEFFSGIPELGFKLNHGIITWAALTKTYWPAFLLGDKYDLCGVPRPRYGFIWAYWFGDNRVSEVSLLKIANFEQKFRYYMNRPIKNTKWKKGVLLAIKELADMYGHHADEWTDEMLIDWGMKGFKPPDNGIRPNPEVFSAFIMTKLKAIRKAQDENNEIVVLSPEQLAAQAQIKNRKLLPKDLCMRCYTNRTVIDHPIFMGRLCTSCKERIRMTIHAFGADGIAYFCTVCGRAGDLLCCDIISCGRGFCTICIDTFCTPHAISAILHLNWSCFVCNTYDPKLNGYLVRRDNWQLNLQTLFVDPNRPEIMQQFIPEVKTGIRVLSLFDGIGTGYVALKKLKINIEKYFACEIDEKSICVTRINHGDGITQLGDVKNIDENTINCLMPIHLVLAASPCNDFSLANPHRKGIFDFSGTGVLFFEFYRILSIIKTKVKNHPLFWLFENVSSMKLETKETISRFLQVEPVMIDANAFSAQNRPRYFWGNIPGLNSIICEYDGQELDLNSSIMVNSLRSATVTKIRTVTTNRFSLRQGSQYPVYDCYGNVGNIWITELETIFGFPVHYTDVGNLSCGQRHQLLGKAWSVPVIVKILKPLTEYFLKESQDSTESQNNQANTSFPSEEPHQSTSRNH